MILGILLSASAEKILECGVFGVFRWRSLLNLLFKSECNLCRRDSLTPICDRCQTKLDRLQHRSRERLQRLSLPVWVWGQYRDELKQAITMMKYNNRPQIGDHLGEHLGRMWLQQVKVGQRQHPPITVVPLPMHVTKRRDRGFDQAEIIAQGFCRATNLPLVNQGLRRIRPTQALFDLSPSERQRELDRALQIGAARAELKRLDRPILLIDDIFTTGATAQAGATALRSAGFSVYGLAAIATTTR
ncbi:MAG: ComF family protein [Coleofasciculaceae cyanobacterium RL_1_1]|nr:ComF family protein [Coleofasciculaceae cyanobacterium RL_1_1]